MSYEIHNGANIIDSRDVIDRIVYLAEERTALEEKVQECRDERDALEDAGADNEEALENAADALAEAKDNLACWDDEYGGELVDLSALQSEAENCTSEWRDGASLIRDTYFVEYAQQFAEDIGAIKDDQGWPYDHIDWEAAADALKMDYSSVTFAGVDYRVRN